MWKSLLLVAFLLCVRVWSQETCGESMDVFFLLDFSEEFNPEQLRAILGGLQLIAYILRSSSNVRSALILFPVTRAGEFTHRSGYIYDLDSTCNETVKALDTLAGNQINFRQSDTTAAYSALEFLANSSDIDNTRETAVVTITVSLSESTEAIQRINESLIDILTQSNDVQFYSVGMASDFRITHDFELELLAFANFDENHWMRYIASSRDFTDTLFDILVTAKVLCRFQVETARKTLDDEVRDGSSRLREYQECVSTHGEACFSKLNVRCTPTNCTDGDIRLVDDEEGRVVEGRVEVCSLGVWTIICDSLWGEPEAIVVCTQLGHKESVAIATRHAAFGRGTSPVLLSQLGCTGNETRLADCFFPLDLPECLCEEGAGVRCLTPPLCEYAEYDCYGQCIPITIFCDGVIDCPYIGIEGSGLDELEDYCGACPDGFYDCQFTTTEGRQCLNNTGLCNRTVECFTGRDEAICYTLLEDEFPTLPPPECDAGEYRCYLGCLPSTTLCNGQGDCVDNLGFAFDEIPLFCMACEEGEVTCNFPDDSTNQCIPNSAMCDGTEDCLSGFDEFEVYCANSHRAPERICSEGDVRLVDGTVESDVIDGRVEVCADGTAWGTVCDNNWVQANANVVCRQLGHMDTGALAFPLATFGQGTGPILLDEVACLGSETRLIDCPANQIGIHSCTHAKDAGVRCQTSDSGFLNSTAAGLDQTDLIAGTIFVSILSLFLLLGIVSISIFIARKRMTSGDNDDSEEDPLYDEIQDGEYDIIESPRNSLHCYDAIQEADIDSFFDDSSFGSSPPESGVALSNASHHYETIPEGNVRIFDVSAGRRYFHQRRAHIYDQIASNRFNQVDYQRVPNYAQPAHDGQVYERVPRVDIAQIIATQGQIYERAPIVDVALLLEDHEQVSNMELHERVPRVDIDQILLGTGVYQRVPAVDMAQLLEGREVYERVPNVELYARAPHVDLAQILVDTEIYQQVPNVNIAQLLEAHGTFEQMPDVRLYERAPHVEVAQILAIQDQIYERAPNVSISQLLEGHETYERVPNVDLYDITPHVDIAQIIGSQTQIYEQAPIVDIEELLEGLEREDPYARVPNVNFIVREDPYAQAPNVDIADFFEREDPDARAPNVDIADILGREDPYARAPNVDITDFLAREEAYEHASNIELEGPPQVSVAQISHADRTSNADDLSALHERENSNDQVPSSESYERHEAAHAERHERAPNAELLAAEDPNDEIFPSS